MKWLKNIFTKNIFIKVLAVILAVFTYLYIHREDIQEKMVKDVEVKIIGLSSGWRVVDQSLEKIDLIISGPRQKVELRNNRNIFVDLSFNDIDYALKGDRFDKTFKVSEALIRGLSYDIKLKFPTKEVPSIRVETALYSTKKLNVKLDVRGKPAPGYTVKWKTFSPTIVNVTGPEYILKYEESIPTNPIPIEGKKSVIDLDVGVNVGYLKKSKGVLFECNSKVHVNVGIKPLPGEKKFTGIPVKILKTQDKIWRITTDPSAIDVTVVGDVDELKEVKKSFIKAYIDADDLPGPGTGIKMGVKFFISGPWESLRIKEDVTVKTDVALPRKEGND